MQTFGNAVQFSSRTLCYTLVLTAIVRQAASLTCYDNTSGGEMKLVTNDEWTMCSLVPSLTGSAASEGKVFGLGPNNDDMAPYMMAFANNDDKYQVLSVCIYERYDFRSLSPKFKAPELLFRCVCNYDKCNSQTNFAYYLEHLSEKPNAAA